jgi:Ca2+-binding RTX toxin-like protein
MANLTGTSGNNTLTGTNTADEITGRLGDDVIYGGDGKDVLYGDMLIGEEKSSINNIFSYRSKSGNDVIHGGDGDDKIVDLFGKSANPSGNMLFGDDGNDTIEGGGILNGGKGDDVIYVWNGEAIGGKGDDTITIPMTYVNRTYLLSGNDGDDTITGNGTLNGGSGDDILQPLGTSTLHGGSGDDILKTSTDYSSILWGNAGNDIFKIAATTSNKVYIKDFMSGQDHIDLSSLNLDHTPEVLDHTDQYVKLDIENHDMEIYVHVMKGQTLTSDDFIF